MDLQQMDGAGLALADLVTLQEDSEVYVIDWPASSVIDGHLQLEALVVMKRLGGVLLALPAGVVPQEVLDRALRGEDSGPVGLSMVAADVPAIVLDGGVRAPTGSDMDVLVVDLAEELLSKLRRLTPEDRLGGVVYFFDQESPFALPDPDFLLRAARNWIREEDDEGLAF